MGTGHMAILGHPSLSLSSPDTLFPSFSQQALTGEGLFYHQLSPRTSRQSSEGVETSDPISLAAQTLEFDQSTAHGKGLVFPMMKRPPSAIFFFCKCGQHYVRRELLFAMVSSYSEESAWIANTYFRANINFMSRSEPNGPLF